MKRLDEMSEEEQKRFMRWGLLTILLIMIVIGIPNIAFMERFFFVSRPGAMSLFPNIGTVLSVFYVTFFLPASIVGEFGASRMINRSFRPRTIFVFWLIFGEISLISVALLTLFNRFFSNTSVSIQAPLLSIGLGIPIIVTAATFRVKWLHHFLERALW